MEYAILSRAVHEGLSGEVAFEKRPGKVAFEKRPGKVAFEKRPEEREASEPWRGTGRKI